MGFWSSYLATRKPTEVEEPIDAYLHRPLGYLVAKAAFPTPLTADMITMLSIVLAIGGGACLVTSFPHHQQAAGLLLLLSAVFDCADGQLARLRGTSSAFGRMLDGLADLIGALAAVGAATYVLWSRHSSPTWFGLVVLAGCVATAVTGSFHTGMYDHYKNVWLHFTEAKGGEGEDYDSVLARYRAATGRRSLYSHVVWLVYLFYLKNQRDYLRRFDPHTTDKIASLPPFDAERAAIYKKHAAGPMRLWRTFFGFGTVIFGVALFAAIDQLEVYLLLRLFVLNLIFYAWLRPAQRRASRESFGEMGILPSEAQVATAEAWPSDASRC